MTVFPRELRPLTSMVEKSTSKFNLIRGRGFKITSTTPTANIDYEVTIRKKQIENILDDDFDEELDLVSSQLSEFIYYNDTKK